MAKQKPGPGGEGQVPGANATAQERSAYFSRTLEQVCDAMGLTLEFLKNLRAKVTDAEGREAIVNLKNLTALVRHYEPAHWPGLMERFLQAGIPSATAKVAEAVDFGLRKNKDRLMPFLKPGTMARESPQFWSEILCRRAPEYDALIHMLQKDLPRGTATPGPLPDRNLLCQTLVIDMPETVAIVRNEAIAESGHPAARWLKKAKENLFAHTPDEWCIVVDEQLGVRSTCADDTFDAARTLLLDDLLPGEAEMGWFVAPMTREVTYFAPATRDSNSPIVRMKKLAENTYANGTRPLSPEVFWVYEGKWHHFPIVLQGEHVFISPPAKFQRVFGLAAGSADGD